MRARWAVEGARYGSGRGGRSRYQACELPQWGQSTDVDTSARNTNPHSQV